MENKVEFALETPVIVKYESRLYDMSCVSENGVEITNHSEYTVSADTAALMIAGCVHMLEAYDELHDHWYNVEHQVSEYWDGRIHATVTAHIYNSDPDAKTSAALEYEVILPAGVKKSVALKLISRTI